MRWFTFILLTFFLLTLQTAVAPRLSLFGARPDWLLVVVVVLAMQAAPRDAAIGAWILGVGADLMTIERFGLISLSYVLVAVVVSSARDYVFRHRWVTQVIVTFVAGASLRFGWLLYGRALYQPGGSWFAAFALDVVIASLYTAAFAPMFHLGFRRVGRALGVALPRYTYAGLHRSGTSRV